MREGKKRQREEQRRNGTGGGGRGGKWRGEVGSREARCIYLGNDSHLWQALSKGGGCGSLCVCVFACVCVAGRGVLWRGLTGWLTQ